VNFDGTRCWDEDGEFLLIEAAELVGECEKPHCSHLSAGPLKLQTRLEMFHVVSSILTHQVYIFQGAISLLHQQSPLTEASLIEGKHNPVSCAVWERIKTFDSGLDCCDSSGFAAQRQIIGLGCCYQRRLPPRFKRNLLLSPPPSERFIIGILMSLLFASLIALSRCSAQSETHILLLRCSSSGACDSQDVYSPNLKASK
jgi:hypothetical protein